MSVSLASPRDLAAILKNFPNEGRTVVILGEDDAMIKRAGGNIKDLRFLTYNRLRAHDLYYGNNVLVFEGAAKKLGEFYGG